MNAALEVFKTRAEAVSAEVHRGSVKRGTLPFILELPRIQGVKARQSPNHGAIFSVLNNRNIFHSKARNSSLAQTPSCSPERSRDKFEARTEGLPGCEVRIRRRLKYAGKSIQVEEIGG